MEPEWLVWARANMPAAMFAEFETEWKHQQRWRDDKIAKLEALLDKLPGENYYYYTFDWANAAARASTSSWRICKLPYDLDNAHDLETFINEVARSVGTDVIITSWRRLKA